MTERYTVVHAASFDEGDNFVFGHAAALAHALKGEIVSLHAHDGTSADPKVLTDKVTSWGFNDFELRIIDHQCCDDVVETLLDGLKAASPDIVVAGSHQKKGLRLLAEGSVSQAVLANSRVPVLIVPLGGRGIVDVETGQLGIRRILVPVGRDSDADRALAFLTDWMERLGARDLDIYLLHVGEGDALDSALFPEHTGWRGHRLQREGRLDEVVADFCAEHGIDLVVMSTDGSDSLSDFFFGTRTEQAVRRVPCPLLAIPPAG